MLYYLWTLTWGLGWVPALAALGGALAVWRRERRLGWLLVPAPLLFLAFMGLQGRYFGRWLLPIFPILCLLAAFFALRCRRRVRCAASRRRVGRASAAACVGVAGSLLVAVLLSARRASSTASTPAWCSRAPTRAT